MATIKAVRLRLRHQLVSALASKMLTQLCSHQRRSVDNRKSKWVYILILFTNTVLVEIIISNVLLHEDKLFYTENWRKENALELSCFNLRNTCIWFKKVSWFSDFFLNFSKKSKKSSLISHFNISYQHSFRNNRYFCKYVSQFN